MALDMLRMEDIINYGSKCLPYLIPFLLLLIVAIVLVFVTKKKTGSQAQADPQRIGDCRTSGAGPGRHRHLYGPHVFVFELGYAAGRRAQR